MPRLKHILRIIINPYKRFSFLASKGLYDRVPEPQYLKKLYKLSVGKDLELSCPTGFTEKIQWIKLYDRNPQYTIMQDKLLMRDFVTERIGSEYLIPLIGSWDKADDIDITAFPDQFVLKCNHDCASVIICRDKSTFNFTEAKSKLNKCLQTDYSKYSVEWAYKDIPRRIIAEKYMQDGETETLTDYKFYCFNGKAKMVMAISGAPHSVERKHTIYDMKWERMPVYKKNDIDSEASFEKPACLEAVAALAEKISEGIPFVRVDFYIINNHPYFGEVAFYPDSGFLEFYPEEWEKRIGSWIELPKHTSD